jgi:hypothetical protein|tara:strand:- start:42 stop:239 length:198 start_codon:yes stop_codon:yes gene_type:complete
MKDKEYLAIYQNSSKKNKPTICKYVNYSVVDIINEFKEEGWHENDNLLYIIDDNNQEQARILYPK